MLASSWWGEGRKLVLGERNRETYWLLQVVFVRCHQWLSMASFSRWEKQKRDFLSYFRTCPDLCGRLKMSSSLGKTPRC